MPTTTNTVTGVMTAEYASLLALGRSLVGAEGSDIVQDALLKAVDEERAIRNPLGWVRRVIRNEAHSWGRSAARRRAREHQTAGQGTEPADLEALVARSQILDALQSAWSELAQPYREALRLRFEEGLSAAQIGQRQGCPTNTASWRVREGICRLRRQLDQRFGDRRQWLGALAAVTGPPSHMDPTAAKSPSMNASVSFTIIAASAIALGVGAVAAVVAPGDLASAPPEGVASDHALGGDVISNRASSEATAVDPTSPPGKATGVAAAPTPPSGAVPHHTTSRAVSDRDYGVQIRTEGVGMSACGDQISEFARIARDVYPGCRVHAGYDPEAEFVLRADFALERGVSRLTGVDASGQGAPGDVLGRCFAESLFPRPAVEEYTPGFKGSMEFTLRPLEDGEESAEARVARVMAEASVEVSIEGAPQRGPQDAALTVVECIDPECPYTRQAAPLVDQLLDSYAGTVRFAQLQNPLEFHQGARDKARALVAAQRQGKYWDAIDYLYTHPGPFTQEAFDAMARALELDVTRWQRDRVSAAAEAEVARQQQACTSAGGIGTPTFFIEGKRLAGAPDFEVMSSVLDAVAADSPTP